MRDEIHRLDRAAVQSYQQHWAPQDPRIEGGASAPVGRPTHERQVVAKARWKKSAILNEFLIPSDVPYVLATWLHKSSTKVVALSFEGSRRRGPFSDEDSRVLQRVMPHIQRALAIRDRLESQNVRASSLASAVEQSHCGVIILDEEGRILEATGPAAKLLSTEVGLRRESDHTLWLPEPAGSQLRQWVANGLPPKDNADGVLTVKGRGGWEDIFTHCGARTLDALVMVQQRPALATFCV